MSHTEVFALPDAGEGLTEAEIVAWRVAVGDDVTVNQPFVEIETAKSSLELPSPFEGRVAALHGSEGDLLAVGAPLVSIEVADDEPDHADDGARPEPAVSPGPTEPEPEDQPAGVGEPTTASTPPAGQPPAVLVGYGVRQEATEAPRPATAATSAPRPPVLAKPPVRKLAKDLGLDLATISPTGPGGIVTREDVLAAQEAQSPARLAIYPGQDEPWLTGGTVTRDGRATRVPVRSVRKRTAEAMVASAFTAPHVTVFHTLDVTRTMNLVERLKADREFADVHVTPLLIAARALLLAVRRHPEINAAWDETGQEIVYKHYVNLGIAAATPRGLVVPNIKDAHRLSLLELGRALGDLVRTARAGETKPGDMADGTITITNVGVFGIDTGTPILNPGEAAILAFGKVTKQPWVHGGKVKPRWVTQLALSFDHRLVDGELGSRVLSDVAAVLADPAMGLVWA